LDNVASTLLLVWTGF